MTQVNWLLDKTGDNIKNKINLGPIYCPSCDITQYKCGTPYKIKKVFNLFKKKEYKKDGVIYTSRCCTGGYSDDISGNIYCSNCNHILYSNSFKKKIKGRINKEIKIIEPCDVCGKETYHSDNYSYMCKCYCKKCFKNKFPNIKIDWNHYYC